GEAVSDGGGGARGVACVRGDECARADGAGGADAGALSGGDGRGRAGRGGGRGRGADRAPGSGGRGGGAGGGGAGAGGRGAEVRRVPVPSAETAVIDPGPANRQTTAVSSEPAWAVPPRRGPRAIVWAGVAMLVACAAGAMIGLVLWPASSARVVEEAID